MSRLLNINTERRVPIYLQIVNSVTDAIRRGNYKKGDRIFSINEMSNEYFLARDTVQKAYNILLNKGVITSIKGKGYYVSNDHPEVQVKVLLLFSRISNYKKQIYNSFIETLGENTVVDFRIHHCSAKLFHELVINNLSDYDYFVVMPHFYDDADQGLETIRIIPPDQLIILDKNIQHAGVPWSGVYQDFQNDIIEAMEQAGSLLSKYNKLFLVYPKIILHSPDIITGFRKFCMQNDFKFEVIAEINDSTKISAGEAYVIIEENDLCNLIRMAGSKGLPVGQQLGILSYNDSPIKEILLDGITVISTDHQQMGRAAAKLILENRSERIRIPFRLIIRKSL